MKTKLFSLCFVLLASMSSCANDATTSDNGSTNDQKAELLCPAPANVQAVDLGLPSGVKWASCNVGAMNPEDYGNYYAFGEVLPKEDSLWVTCRQDNDFDEAAQKYLYASLGVRDDEEYNKYFDEMSEKYSSDFSAAFNMVTLAPSDDAAHVNWGENWRMPTYEEWEELNKECTWTWTKRNDVNGYLVTSKKNAMSIFLPAWGMSCDGKLNFVGEFGCYWSSSFYENYPTSAGNFGFELKSRYGSFPLYSVYSYRFLRLPIRPVCE